MIIYRYTSTSTSRKIAINHQKLKESSIRWLQYLELPCSMKVI